MSTGDMMKKALSTLIYPRTNNEVTSNENKKRFFNRLVDSIPRRKGASIVELFAGTGNGVFATLNGFGHVAVENDSKRASAYRAKHKSAIVVVSDNVQWIEEGGLSDLDIAAADIDATSDPFQAAEALFANMKKNGPTLVTLTWGYLGHSIRTKGMVREKAWAEMQRKTSSLAKKNGMTAKALCWSWPTRPKGKRASNHLIYGAFSVSSNGEHVKYDNSEEAMSNEVQKQLFGYPAGKSALAKKLVAMIPPHKKYVEPFVGSGAVLLAKDKADVEIVNDIDKDVADVWRILSKLSDSLIESLDKKDWAPSKEKFESLKRSVPSDDAGKLYKFLYMTRWSFGNHRESFSDNNKGKSFTVTPRLKRFKDRFAGINSFNSDYKDICKEHDSGETFFFFDPPYVGYDHGVGEKEFNEKEFFDILCSLKGNWLVTYGVNGALPKLLKSKFKVSKISQFRALSNCRGGSKTLDQIVCTNYEIKKTEIEKAHQLFVQEPGYLVSRLASDEPAGVLLDGAMPDGVGPEFVLAKQDGDAVVGYGVVSLSLPVTFQDRFEASDRIRKHVGDKEMDQALRESAPVHYHKLEAVDLWDAPCDIVSGIAKISPVGLDLPNLYFDEKEIPKLSVSKQLRGLDIFAGIGGLSQAAKKCGVDVVCAVELEHAQAEVHAKNASAAVLCKDVRKVDLDVLSNRLGRIDLIIGGVPCEPFSTARSKGTGRKTDPRRDLINTALKYVEKFSPSYIAFENVPQVARHDLWKRATKKLEQLGYSARIVIGQHDKCGGSTIRKRACLMASKKSTVDDLVCSGKMLTSPQKLFADLGEPSTNHRDKYHQEKKIPGPTAMANAQSRRQGNGPVSSYGARGTIVLRDKPSPTIVATPASSPCHWNGNRFLTSREVMRLQDFQDSFDMLEPSRNRVVSMLGDVVPIKLGVAFIRHLLGQNETKKASMPGTLPPEAGEFFDPDEGQEQKKAALLYVLSDEAVAKSWLPDDGSGLPETLESTVPLALRYWCYPEREDKIMMRDLLVESGWLAPERIAKIDGELRRLAVYDGDGSDFSPLDRGGKTVAPSPVALEHDGSGVSGEPDESSSANADRILKRLLKPMQITKASAKDDDWGYVLSVALEANDGEDGNPLKPDAHDDILSEEQLCDTAREYLRDWRKFGIMHRGRQLPANDVRIADSFVLPHGWKLQTNKGKVYDHPVWLLGAEIKRKSDLWKKIESGEINAWSIDGRGMRIPEKVKRK